MSARDDTDDLLQLPDVVAEAFIRAGWRPRVRRERDLFSEEFPRASTLLDELSGLVVEALPQSGPLIPTSLEFRISSHEAEREFDDADHRRLLPELLGVSLCPIAYGGGSHAFLLVADNGWIFTLSFSGTGCYLMGTSFSDAAWRILTGQRRLPVVWGDPDVPWQLHLDPLELQQQMSVLEPFRIERGQGLQGAAPVFPTKPPPRTPGAIERLVEWQDEQNRRRFHPLSLRFLIPCVVVGAASFFCFLLTSATLALRISATATLVPFGALSFACLAAATDEAEVRRQPRSGLVSIIIAVFCLAWLVCLAGIWIR